MSVQISPLAPLAPTSTSPTGPMSTGSGASGSASLASSTGLAGLGGSMDAAPRLGTLPGAMMGTALAKSGTAMEEGEAKMVIRAGKSLLDLMGDPVKKA